MRTDKQNAMLYAAQKLLERQLEAEDSDLPPGYEIDLSGQSITIRFAEGTIVRRDGGLQGDGKILKKATQNMYGYPVWAMFVERLMKFHQWNVLKAEIIEAVKAALKYRGDAKTVRTILNRDKPDLVAIMNELQQDLPIPARSENTPREVLADLPPTISITSPKG